MMRGLPLMLVPALLAACADQGTIERDRMSDLAVGRTTTTELASAWGPPLMDTTTTDSRRVWTYRTIHMQTGPITTMVPGFGPIGSTSETLMGQVTLTFDAQGVLLSVTYTR